MYVFSFLVSATSISVHHRETSVFIVMSFLPTATQPDHNPVQQSAGGVRSADRQVRGGGWGGRQPARDGQQAADRPAEPAIQVRQGHGRPHGGTGGLAVSVGPVWPMFSLLGNLKENMSLRSLSWVENGQRKGGKKNCQLCSDTLSCVSSTAAGWMPVSLSWRIWPSKLASEPANSRRRRTNWRWKSENLPWN